MAEFILRSRKGRSTADCSLDELSSAGHFEILTSCIVNALFYSGNIRPLTAIHIVFDGPAAPPKTVRFESDRLGSLDGHTERAIGGVVQRALVAGRSLHLGEEVAVDDGLFVAKLSFEQLVKEKCQVGPCFYLNRRGCDIRSTQLDPAAVFVFSDHMSMPKKSEKHLERLGASALSVGPRTLFASQCIAVVQNELDRREFGAKPAASA
jgi:tRNA (pseudouridine54-N1)-methyltransferase